MHILSLRSQQVLSTFVKILSLWILHIKEEIVGITYMGVRLVCQGLIKVAH